MHLVCLGDGTNIPCQVSATAQFLREKCLVNVKALCDERLGSPDDPKLRFLGGVLTYGRHVLDNVKDVEVLDGLALTDDGKGEMGRISFTVECELPDTIEQPKPYLEC